MGSLKQKAAIIIQKIHRGKIGRKKTLKKQKELNELNKKMESLKQQAAIIIQKIHRGKMGRKKASIRKKYSLPQDKIEQDEIIPETPKDVIETDAIELDVGEIDAEEQDGLETDAIELVVGEIDAEEQDGLETDAIELVVGEIDAEEQDGLESDAIELDVGEPEKLDEFEDILEEFKELAKKFEEESGISLETHKDDIKPDSTELKDLELEGILEEFENFQKKLKMKKMKIRRKMMKKMKKMNISPMSQGEVENISLNKDNYRTTLKSYIMEALEAQDEERLNALITIITVGQPDVKGIFIIWITAIYK